MLGERIKLVQPILANLAPRFSPVLHFTKSISVQTSCQSNSCKRPYLEDIYVYIYIYIYINVLFMHKYVDLKNLFVSSMPNIKQFFFFTFLLYVSGACRGF